MMIDIPDKRARSILKKLVGAALEAADPVKAITKTVKVKQGVLWVGTHRYALKNFDRGVCVGAGKASGRMAQALEKQLGAFLTTGLVVVKDGQGCWTKKVEIREAGHPLPDQRGERAVRELLRLVGSLTADDLLMVLISGGASSLLPAPVSGVSLTDKQNTTDLLLRSGATIQEINAVRKHVSRIKGGKLAAATSARIVTLILSDVLGDDMATIGSGPTVPDPTTFKEARGILQSYELWGVIPASVRKHLEDGVKGKTPETPKPDSLMFDRIHNEIIGNNRRAVEHVAQTAKQLGIHTCMLTTTVQSEAREIGKVLAGIAQEINRSGHPVRRPACVVLGGETTVTIKGKGKSKGGRAQELALSAAIAVAGLPDTYVMAFGTDGTDGPTDAAGAVVDGQTMERAKKRKKDPSQALVKHASYDFFQKVGGHIKTGSTGTNVNDIYLILVL